METYHLENVLEAVIKIARETGEFIAQEGKNFNTGKIEYKGKNDLVSYVDKNAEKKLVECLSPLVPNAGFIAEEGTGEKNENGLNWVIDPLDGTTNFMHGFPPFSISIGLMDKDEVILGVILEVSSGECYYAVKGGKSYCNGTEIRVSQVPDFKEGLYITGYPYREFKKYRNFYELMYYFLSNTHGLRRLGSAAIDLAYVASGKAEGFFEFFLNPWDVAAGSLIVRQAGGVVSDFTGGNNFLFGKELIAGSSHVHNEMVKTIHRFWNKEYPTDPL